MCWEVSPRCGPASTQRYIHLRPVHELPAHGDAYLFGDAIGGQMAFPRKAWETAVLKAHGHSPTWTRTNGLALESRAALKAIDLHFHDLRHEGASRLLEAGWPLMDIQQMLGHASLAQTAEYLNVRKRGPHDSMRRFGTRPLHSVAPAPSTEHAPTAQQTVDEGEKPTVN